MKKEEICKVCKKEELTGAVFMIRLRHPGKMEKVTPGPAVCDACAMRLFEFFKQLELNGWNGA